jgi:hypothetical protein
MPNPAFQDLAQKRMAFLAGAYAALTLKLGSRVVLVPAFRHDVYMEGGATATTPGPRMTARVRVAGAVWLKATAGRYSQLPSFPLQVAGFDGFGLPTYGLQTAWQSALGVEAPVPFGLALDVTGFLQRSVLTDIRDPDSGDYLLDDFLVKRQALAYGVELMLRRPVRSPLYGWLAYTLSRSLRQFEGGSIGPSDWDQRHIFNLVVGYRFGPYTVGGRAHLHTGRPVKIDGLLPVEYGRLPTFYQIDLRAERRFLFDRYSLHLYAEIVNATVSRQITGLRQDVTGIGESGFTIAIPSIGVRGEL